MLDFISIALIIIVMYPCYEPLEKFRYDLLKDKYTTIVEEEIPVLQNVKDTSWSEIKLDTTVPLAIKNKIIYFKRGKSIAIYFPTYISTFRNSGFIYFADNTARDFLDHPSKYDIYKANEAGYDYKIDYSTYWAYIKLY